MKRAVSVVLMGLSLSLAAADGLADSPRLLAFCGPRVIRFDINVSIDGQKQTDLWHHALKSLFEHLDVDSNGALDAKEAERVPSALRIRQLAWSYLFAVPEAASWSDLDVEPKDGRVNLNELSEYYRRRGVGSPYVVISEGQNAKSLNNVVLQAIDQDKNGSIDQKEWQAADTILRRFDANDNEIVGADELVPRTLYPGPAGTLLLTPTTQDLSWPKSLSQFPILQMPSWKDENSWSRVWRSRRRSNEHGMPLAESGLDAEVAAKLDANRDGLLVDAELATIRGLPADATLEVKFAPTAPLARWTGQAPKNVRECATIAWGDVRLVAYAAPGRAPAESTAAIATALERFDESDTDHDQFVSPAEMKKSTYAPLRDHGPMADRDRDGRLSKREWTTYLRVRRQLIDTQVVVTLIDLSQNLFELLDGDGDGGLSVPEIRAGWQRLTWLKCVNGNRIEMAQVPRTIRIVCSRGLPKSLLHTPPSEGPDWFRALDRNNDGLVSRREFLGTDEAFRKLDANHDNLITAEEAKNNTMD